MKRTLLLTLCILLPELAHSQFYFPLRPGNWWSFLECGGHVACEGSMFIARVIKDSTIAGKTYSMTQYLFPARFVRQEGNRLFAYDTTETTEFLLFDFSARAGDTISIRANQTKFIFAGTNYTFVQRDTTKADPYRDIGWALRDSFGVLKQWGYLCIDCSRSGFIDGKSVLLNAADPSTNAAIPNTPILEQNYPNPFNPMTLIRFAVPSDDLVKLEIFNSLGETVSVLLSKRLSAGWHSVSWNASDLASGHYYCRLTVGHSVLTTTMVLLK